MLAGAKEIELLIFHLLYELVRGAHADEVGRGGVAIPCGRNRESKDNQFHHFMYLGHVLLVFEEGLVGGAWGKVAVEVVH